MEFGKVTPEDLVSVNFQLPADDPATTSVLEKSAGNRFEIYAGCAKWGRKDWVGKIYPKGTKDADFLEHYARFFNSIELNATFYKIPTRAQAQSWAAKVGEDFRFCPKFSDKISHLKRLKDVDALTGRFLEGVSGFGKNLGPSFLMIHPGMGPKSLEVLENFLQSLPGDFQIVVELRHPQWYSDPAAFTGVFQMLERNKAGSVITDSSGRRDCVHMRLTTPQAFIRFVGNGLHPTDYERVDAWVARIKSWKAKGIKKVYFFMHQENEIHSPELCRYFIQRMNLQGGTMLREPVFINSAAKPSSAC